MEGASTGSGGPCYHVFITSLLSAGTGCSQFTFHMSCPNLEADVSPRSMVSFSRKWYFKITVWVLGTLIGTGWSLCLGFLREQRSILIAAVQTQDNQLRLLFYVSTFFCVNSSGSKHKGDVELEYFLIIHLLFVLVESHYSSLSNESRYSLVRY